MGKVNNLARLVVVASSEDTVASPGNRLSNYIAVSVTDVNGEPVIGLTAENFKVDPMIAGIGGSPVDIANVFAGRLPGFYYVTVVPHNMETWRGGVHIFAIAVQKGADKGQTIASVLMD